MQTWQTKKNTFGHFFDAIHFLFIIWMHYKHIYYLSFRSVQTNETGASDHQRRIMTSIHFHCALQIIINELIFGVHLHRTFGQHMTSSDVLIECEIWMSANEHMIGADKALPKYAFNENLMEFPLSLRKWMFVFSLLFFFFRFIKFWAKYFFIHQGLFFTIQTLGFESLKGLNWFQRTRNKSQILSNQNWIQ